MTILFKKKEFLLFDKKFSESNLGIRGCLEIYHIGIFIMAKVVEIPVQTELNISTVKVNGILDLMII